MKRIVALFSVAAAVLSHGAENMLSFGDFAKDDLKQWYLNSRQRPLKPYVIKDGILYGKSVDKIPANDFIALSRPIPALQKGAMYEFGGKIRFNTVPAKGKMFRFSIREVNDKGKSLRYYNISPLLTSKGQWLEIRGIFTARPEAASHQFYIVMTNFTPADSVEIDEIFVRKLETASPEADNLVANGGFEAGLAGWSNPSDVGSASTAISFDGKDGKCLRVSGNQVSRYNRFKTVVQDLPALEKGKKYVLSFSAKANMTAAPKKLFGVWVREVNDKGRTVRYIGDKITSGSDWKDYSREFTPAANAAKAILLISSENMADTDEGFADNIKLIKK